MVELEMLGAQLLDLISHPTQPNQNNSKNSNKTTTKTATKQQQKQQQNNKQPNQNRSCGVKPHDQLASHFCKLGKSASNGHETYIYI